MNKRIFIAITLLFLTTLSSFAQQFSIKGIEKLQTDMDARVNYPRKDQNGKTCAIIKIATPLTGFSFDTGTLQVQYVVEKTGEIWVYVQPGVRKITIAHQTLGVVREWEFPIRIEEACAYAMTLNVNEGGLSHTANQDNLNPNLTRRILFKLRKNEVIQYGETAISLMNSGEDFAILTRDTLLRKEYLIVNGIRKVEADTLHVTYIDFENNDNSVYAWGERENYVDKDGNLVRYSWHAYLHGEKHFIFEKTKYEWERILFTNEYFGCPTHKQTQGWLVEIESENPFKFVSTLDMPIKPASSDFDLIIHRKPDTIANNRHYAYIIDKGVIKLNGKTYDFSLMHKNEKGGHEYAILKNGDVCVTFNNGRENFKYYIDAKKKSARLLNKDEDFNFIKQKIAPRYMDDGSFFNFTNHGWEVYFEEKEVRTLKDESGQHLLETSLALPYVIVDEHEFGNAPALGIWYRRALNSSEKSEFLWTALEGKELVLYSYSF